MKKSIYLFLFIAQLSYGQNAKIDSLNTLLPLSEGSHRADVLLELATVFIDIDNQQSLTFGMEAFKMAMNSGDSLRIVKAGKVSSRALRRLGRYDSVITLGSYCERIAFRNNFDFDDRATLLNSLGATHLMFSKYDRALLCFLTARELFEKVENKAAISMVLNNIGLTYYKLKDYRLGLTYYEKALTFKESIGSDPVLDNLMVNISISNAFLDNLREARLTLKPITDKCRSKCTEFIFVTAFYTSGLIWYKSDSLRNAEKDFLWSYSTAKKTGELRFVFDNIIYLSKIYLKLGKFSEAERFLNEGEKMTRSTSLNLEEMKIYEELSALYKAKGDFGKMSFYRTKYIQASDSIYNESQTNNLMQLHAEATEREYKTQLASQEQMLNLKNEVINKQLGINILIGVALLLLSILVYVLVRIFQDRRQANVLLTKKVNERTNELERNHRDLMKVSEQQNKALAQWTNTLNISVDSMRALCSTALSEELNPEAHLYFKEIDGVTSKVSKSLDNIRVI